MTGMDNPELDARLVSAVADPAALGDFVNGFIASPLLVPMQMTDGMAYPISKPRADGAALVVFTGEQHSVQVEFPAANDVVVLNGARVIDIANPDRGVLVNPGPQELYLPIALVTHVHPQLPPQLLASRSDTAGQQTASEPDPTAGSLQSMTQAQTTLAGNAYRWLSQGGPFDTADFFVAFCGREHTARGSVVSAGQTTSIAVPEPMLDEFQVLRRAAADPQKGSWVGAELHLTAAGSFSFSFVYDDRLDFGAADPRVPRTNDDPVPDLDAWRAEFASQGRAPEFVPAWAR
ncbi:SseB family protein [Curtobacterium sp. MCLR17_007]|uniref:SseB family protein n=1 Tax=Curtobacterium sp. MCLR17_007 TaxID=2175648 RepID=UPI000DAA4E36|nr:SseB family protein [Curtobacterium sp. MCLR17_007]WIB58759.1 SseB family protein [Curtobacterium sp. MCLR17_007]